MQPISISTFLIPSHFQAQLILVPINKQGNVHMKLKTKLGLLLLSIVLPLSPTLAEEKVVETHQGIEITVNINQASAEEIATLLKGIGLKKAQAIVEYRQQNGDFKTKEDLSLVKGIGAVTVRQNAERIIL
ncbi:COME operon protein 1 [Vibrio anguillarum 775]|nr:COME operon protein 1 [Vibrio anguillarum 775]